MPTVVTRLADETAYLGAVLRSGLLRPGHPRVAAAAARAVRAEGPLGVTLALPLARHPGRVAVVDDAGATTYAELDARADAAARAWQARGVRAGDKVGLLARNHAGFLAAVVAATRLGVRLVLLNAEFARPQLDEVAAREGVRLLVADDDLLPGAGAPLGRLTTRPQAGLPGGPLPAPAEHASIVILTSGTTGTPKGARRQQPRGLATLGGLLSAVPLRAGGTTVICAPLFHALGLTHAVLASALGTTIVLRRRFDPVVALNDLADRRATGLIAVPIMLRRILDAHDEEGGAADLSQLRVVFVAGSQLGGALATRALETLGDVVYNLYGSTEVAYATVASPADLRAAPACVGRVVRGARVRVVDDADADVPAGVTGRIFVGNALPFEGYTGGGGKEQLDGLLATGDVGHFDTAGRLTIDGRDDDMIVSGGENVFPSEVEEVLAAHPGIADAAVVGVPDDEFGARLRAFVVVRPGAALDADDVRAAVRDRLARFKTPRDVVFLDELPRNPTGKVLTRDLV